VRPKEREGRSAGKKRGRAGGEREKLSLLCSCNLDAQVVYRGACIFHCLVSPLSLSLSHSLPQPPRYTLCGAARGIRRAECIRDVPVDVCIDEKIASVPILYRGRPSPVHSPSLSLSLSFRIFLSFLVFPYSFFRPSRRSYVALEMRRLFDRFSRG